MHCAGRHLQLLRHSLHAAGVCMWVCQWLHLRPLVPACVRAHLPVCCCCSLPPPKHTHHHIIPPAAPGQGAPPGALLAGVW
jgi:hypothetical protein